MVVLPEMKRFRYADSLATGYIAAGGTLGILIPPSTVMIIYGILTEQPIASLFIAGIIPGVALKRSFHGHHLCDGQAQSEVGPTGSEVQHAGKAPLLEEHLEHPLSFPGGNRGLYGGWFTPTEAAGAGAFGAFMITLFRGKLTWKNLKDSLYQTTLTTAMVFAILIGANIFGYFLTVSQIPEQLSRWIAGLGLNRYLVMAIIVFLYMV